MRVTTTTTTITTWEDRLEYQFNRAGQTDEAARRMQQEIDRRSESEGRAMSAKCRRPEGGKEVRIRGIMI